MKATLPSRPLLMVVTDPSIPNLDARVLAAACGGAHLVRVRPAGPWEAAHARLVRLLREQATMARVICPADAPAEAITLAHGTHLPQDAQWPQDLPAGWLVGRSTHVAAAPDADRLDYAVFGTVYASATHPGGRAAGLEALAEACRALAPLPVLAIGGITAENAADCVRAGAAGVAVIRSVLCAQDPAQAAADIIQAMREAI